MFAVVCKHYIANFEHLSTIKGCKRMGRRRANRIKQILEKIKNIKQSNHIYTGPQFIFMRGPQQP